MRDRLTKGQKKRLAGFVERHPHAFLEVVRDGAIYTVSLVSSVSAKRPHRSFLFRRDTDRGPSQNPFRLSRGFREYLALTEEADDLIGLLRDILPIAQEKGRERAQADSRREIDALHARIGELKAALKQQEADHRSHVDRLVFGTLGKRGQQ